MPWLFVDYEQGAGGEYFCSNLSQSPQCVPLASTVYPNGRTKVYDRFDQEWLKKNPQASLIKADSDLYELVPIHRRTRLAKELLGEVNSIRIACPQNPQMWKFIRQQQMEKVLLCREPSDSYFVGMLRILAEDSQDKRWLSKVRRDHDVLALTLLSQGIEPTEENRQMHIRDLMAFKPNEPDYQYDLIIPYEKLCQTPDLVKQDLLQKFGIEIQHDWLSKFKQNYDAWVAKT